MTSMTDDLYSPLFEYTPNVCRLPLVRYVATVKTMYCVDAYAGQIVYVRWVSKVLRQGDGVIREIWKKEIL